MKTKVAFFVTFLLLSQQWGHAQDADRTAEAAGQEFLLRAAEYAEYQIEATDRLSNQRLDWTLPDGSQASVALDGIGRIKEFRSGGSSVAVTADVFELAEELFYASFSLDDGRRALTLVADRENGRLMKIESRRPDPGEGTHMAQVSVSQGLLNNADGEVESLSVTDKMAGVRLTAHYADEIAYEQIYLNAQRVTWHGVTGPEAGFADTEVYDSYEVRDGVFLISWSEKVLTTHMIFLFDFNTGHEIGTIFGYEPEYDRAVLETIGATIDLVQGPSD